jgi:hypothetical protein
MDSMLKFPGNLLILCDTPIDLSFSAVFFCVSYSWVIGLLKAASLYPFCLDVFLVCWISFLRHSVTYCLDTVNECSSDLFIFTASRSAVEPT